MRSYIGITDFVSANQVLAMLEVLRINRKETSKRMLHVGVMTKEKIIRREPSKWKGIYPEKESFSHIFGVVEEDVCNCLHYVETDRNRAFREPLREAIGFCGNHLSAVQLDLVWPSPMELVKLVEEIEMDFEIILQIGKTAFDEVLVNPVELVKRLSNYVGIVDRVLLDLSGGRGIEMDPYMLSAFVRAVRRELPMGVGVAGGLGPDTCSLLVPIAAEFPDISVDAQGKLRRSGDSKDPIDWDLASIYLERALRILD